MEIVLYETIIKAKKPKNNREKGFFGIVGETDKFWIVCDKNSSQYSSYGNRTKFSKSTLHEKFSCSDFWHCYSCGNDSHTWRCKTCWP